MRPGKLMRRSWHVLSRPVYCADHPVTGPADWYEISLAMNKRKWCGSSRTQAAASPGPSQPGHSRQRRLLNPQVRLPGLLKTTARRISAFPSQTEIAAACEHGLGGGVRCELVLRAQTLEKMGCTRKQPINQDLVGKTFSRRMIAGSRRKDRQ